MSRLPDPAQRLPDLPTLIKLGACDIRTWAIEFSPPPGPRGVDPNMKPTQWKCCITTADASRPMISAVRETGPEAESAAKALFVETMSRRPSKPVKVAPAPAPALKPAIEDDLDDDAAGLI